jgi:glycosyltransferase involved in cell wall biosynthesis
MARLNILLINHYAGSTRHGMEYRPYYLAREWIRLGHRVRIVASATSHVRTTAPDLNGRLRLDETIDGIEYTWYATPPYQGNGASRVRNIAAFVMRLYRAGPDLVREVRPDVVIASSTYPLDIWPAHRIARLAGARLLHEVHDLWPLTPMELGGFSKWHPFIMLMQAAENYACRHADAIVSILPKVREHLEAHGMAPHKLHVVPNGFDPAEWMGDAGELPPDLEHTLATQRRHGRFLVGYAGTLGVSNAMGTLLEAAARLRAQPVDFIVVGNGPHKQALQRQAAALELTNVYFFPAIHKQRIPMLLERVDVAYIGLKHQPLYRFGLGSNKLIDYMMAARPVLHAVQAGNDPVTEAGCGISVAPENPQAVADGVLSLMALAPARRAELGQRGRDYALANHAYPVLGQRFLTVCAGGSHG